MLDKTQDAPTGEGDTARADEAVQSQDTAHQEAPTEGGQAEGGEAAEQQPEGSGGTPEPTQQAEEPEAEPDRPEMPAWMQRRINELTRQKHDAERRAQAAEERLNGRPSTEDSAAQREAEDTVRQNNPGLSQEDVQRAAQQLRAAERFNESCDAVFEQGSQKFPDFEKTIGRFRDLGGLQQDFLEQTLEAGNAHLVLHHLGRNLDEADRIMTMPAGKRMAALVRLSDKLSAPPPPKAVSKAPAPIEPVSGAGRPSAPNTDPDSLSTEEWMRRRDAGEIR